MKFRESDRASRPPVSPLRVKWIFLVPVTRLTRHQDRFVRTVNQLPILWWSDYCSFAYSALASFRMGMSGSASFQSVRNS